MKLGFVKAVTAVVADSWRDDENYANEMFGDVVWKHTPKSAVYMNRVVERSHDHTDFLEMRLLMGCPDLDRS